mgnify:CR=1 FL=1
MARRISEKQKKEIIEDFNNKKTIDEISKKFNFTKLTISRHLKKNLGEEKYSELIKISKLVKESYYSKKISDQSNSEVIDLAISSEKDSFNENQFIEIAPLDYEVDNQPQKDLSSLSIEEADLPKIVYIIVDKKIELEPKPLKDFIEWNFLSEEELSRLTIEIFVDLKIAKRSITKEQKVIKVPNSDVFRIAAPFLLNKGISRLVGSGFLIAL